MNKSILAGLVLALGAAWQPAAAEASGTLVLDDFQTLDARSPRGTSWVTFTDGVMGGLSTATLTFEAVRGKPSLRLRGRVRLENRGGFIQAALPLAAEGKVLDAGAYRGVRLTVSGTPGSYAVHLKTSDHGLPWQHHAAPLPVGAAWRTVELPFSAFERSGWDARDLNPAHLQRIGLVASKQAFEADLAVAHLSLY